MGSSAAWLSVISLLSHGVNVACNVGLIVIIAGAVRRHRPDAYGPLLAWAIASVAFGFVSPLLQFAASAIAASHGMDGFVFGQAIVATIFGIVHIGLVILLARGLVRLAQPPKQPVADSGAAYR
jgi:hypothetical protein